jgi:hypothetical protein
VAASMCMVFGCLSHMQKSELSGLVVALQMRLVYQREQCWCELRGTKLTGWSTAVGSSCSTHKSISVSQVARLTVSSCVSWSVMTPALLLLLLPPAGRQRPHQPQAAWRAPQA